MLPVDSPNLLAAAAVLGIAVLFLLLLLLFWQGRDVQRVRLMAEQALLGQRSEAEQTRRELGLALQRIGGDFADRLAQMSEKTAVLRAETAAGIETARATLAREQGELRAAVAEGQGRSDRAVAQQAEATRAALEAKLAEIQRTVNEELHSAVEKQMSESFARVIDQFTAVQRAMADVQAVTAQIGDIRRLFSNVRTRGGWGEAQVRAMLDDILPPGGYETNRKLREGSDEAVEFAVLMPMRGDTRPYLPVDAKFPTEDYERLLIASQAGDAEAERTATRALERRIRDEAAKIRQKYINPPVTVEFAVLYLPTDALYAEVARLPGLIDEVGRLQRVLILGPTLLPALLRTIQLGHVTLALERNARVIAELLAATRVEMVKMDGVLDKLARQVTTFGNTIDSARTRTRVVARKLRGMETMEMGRAEALLGLEGEVEDEAEPDG
jgi:DNA recombination protein RmuC